MNDSTHLVVVVVVVVVAGLMWLSVRRPSKWRFEVGKTLALPKRESPHKLEKSYR